MQIMQNNPASRSAAPPLEGGPPRRLNSRRASYSSHLTVLYVRGRSQARQYEYSEAIHSDRRRKNQRGRVLDGERTADGGRRTDRFQLPPRPSRTGARSFFATLRIDVPGDPTSCTPYHRWVVAYGINLPSSPVNTDSLDRIPLRHAADQFEAQMDVSGRGVCR